MTPPSPQAITTKWNYLGGTYTITGGTVSVWLEDRGANGTVIADAVRLVRVGDVAAMGAGRVAIPARRAVTGLFRA